MTDLLIAGIVGVVAGIGGYYAGKARGWRIGHSRGKREGYREGLQFCPSKPPETGFIEGEGTLTWYQRPSPCDVNTCPSNGDCTQCDEGCGV
jgi:hypothetical protein